jgi:hypothetical protein
MSDRRIYRPVADADKCWAVLDGKDGVKMCRCLVEFAVAPSGL